MDLRARIVKPGLLGLGKRDLQAVGRTAIAEAGLYWHRNYKKHHFQNYAVQKYAYRRRGVKYQQLKQRLHPEAQGRPLVFSGESERLAMASQKVEATATSWERSTAQVRLDGPNLNFHAAEMTRVTVFEERRLAAEFATVFERRLTVAATIGRSA